MSDFEAKLSLVGGPTLLIQMNGVRLLTDPTFDEPSEYESSGIVLKKTTGPAISAEAIGAVDAVLVSHEQHLDNLDRAGRAFLPRAKNVFTTRAGAPKLGANAVGLATWETQTFEGRNGGRLHITATPARHGPHGIEPMSGDVAGFAIGVDEPGDAIYATGDTVWYQGVAEVAQRFRPRLVIAFAGAARPRGPFHVTMDNNDAIETAAAFPNAKIVAIHNDGWAHFSESAADLERVFERFGLGKRLIKIAPGETISVKL